ncbi:IS110 family transposase [Actinomadura sp. CNU-125]|uniref:IS110 family transposase n=1 Tax=Actinomadura sp. CNU-125 TaxID=1904961 RepID=UPI0009633DC1|nr:IS110 family transposase [Actinomadura sp. CNU-125]OLT17762.1 IS110 family transposase [Actinomadura sp. CNU-125]
MATSTDGLSAEPVFAGIDWGGTCHQLCIVDATGQVLVQRRVRHDVAGLAELDEQLAGRADVKVAIERGEGLLVEHLQQRGLPVYCVSPKVSARARERYRLAATKSDAFDAFVLADTLRHEHPHWRPLSVPAALTAELAAVTRDRERIVVSQRSVESRLRAILESYHPAPLHLFSSLDRDIALAFIGDYPTPAQAGRVGEARMEGFCRRHGYSGRVEPAVLVERMRPHLLTAAPGTTAGKQFTAGLFVDQLRLFNGQVRACDKRLAELLDAHPDAPIFRSFPGIGPVTAAVLISEMGDDRARYPHPAVLLAETGLAPVTRASGRMHQVRFRYAANKRMRHAIDWWAFTSTRETDWARQAYEDARARGHGKYRALRGLGARWTRILWRCWTDHVPYDAAKHPAAQQDNTAA